MGAALVAAALASGGCGSDAPQPSFEDVLAEAARSVYLVVATTGEGDSTEDEPIATAFVVGDGVLATNAHVAETYDILRGRSRLVVRSPGRAPRDFLVSAVDVHPGYAAFRRKWLERLPIARGSKGQSVAVPPPSAFDVAILRVYELGLASPLQFAPAGASHLVAGRGIGLVGFPMENVVVGGVNPRRPVPQVRVGIVTAVTDWFFGAADAADAQLVHHSMIASGGSSGSPVLSQDGHVVAVHSSGNLVTLPGIGRLETGSGVAYAQRVDLVREVLDGRAASKAEARAAAWTEALARFPSGREILLAEHEPILMPLLAAWEREAGVRATRVADEVGFLAPEARVADPGMFGTFAGTHMRSYAPGSGAEARKHLAIVVPHAVLDLDLQVWRDETYPNQRRTLRLAGKEYSLFDMRSVAVSQDTGTNPVAAVRFSVEPSSMSVVSSYRFRVMGPENGASYSIYFYEGS